MGITCPGMMMFGTPKGEPKDTINDDVDVDVDGCAQGEENETNLTLHPILQPGEIDFKNATIDKETVKYVQRYHFEITRGFSNIPNPEHLEMFTKCVAHLVRGGGKISKKEEEYILGNRLCAQGVTAQNKDLIKQFIQEKKKFDLGSTLTRSGDVVYRSAIYEAIMTAQCDGPSNYKCGQKNEIRKFAEETGISEETVHKLECLAHEHWELRDKTINTLFPPRAALLNKIRVDPVETHVSLKMKRPKTLDSRGKFSLLTIDTNDKKKKYDSWSTNNNNPRRFKGLMTL